MARRFISRLASIVAMWTLAAGCAQVPPVAPYVEAPEFEPYSIERIRLSVSDAGSRGGATRETRDVEAAFRMALIAKGYQVLVSNSQGGSGAAQLDVTVDPRENRSESREKFNPRTGYTNYVTVYIARALISGQLLSPQGQVMWTSQQPMDAESEKSPQDAQYAAIQMAAARVARAFPYRSRPVDKEGRPYDPRITLPQ